MLDTQVEAAVDSKPSVSANPLCFLMDEDFVFRQGLAKVLRQDSIDVVEFSNSARFLDMVDDQRPNVVFIDLKGGAPHECIRALLALKECGYAGAVQLFGLCEQRTLESFSTVGTDCALTMLPPLRKPITVAAIRRIILEQKLSAPAAATTGISLGDALQRNLVKFLYQPKFDLKTNTMIGAEVVARVAHPQLGLVTTDQFPKAADEEALLKLSRLALVKALKTSAHFYELGIALLVAINIGVDSLMQLPICDIVMLHRPESRNWPGLLLEIPERQVGSRIELLKARAAKFQQSGISIAIDNFGCGASRLDILHQMQFAEIKIDRSLVHGCASHVGNATTIKMLIQMAHNFGCRAAAVGISFAEDFRLLSELGCEVGQGFFLSKPMTWQQIDGLITGFKSRSA
jgi:EAL domain-containing protein (putative c-di-GMP-specific phosphodiesterase class I)